MFQLTPKQVTDLRNRIIYGPDVNLTTDVGYFMIWYASAELAFTNLLALASRAGDLEVFDTLCSGMDFRVKIERFRRIRRGNGGIGSNLDVRLKYLDEKCRPIRNRLSHCAISRSEKRDGVYQASTLATLPWDDFQMELPHGISFKPPITYTEAQLLGWALWLTKFVTDVSAAHGHAVATGEFEIVNPLTPEPPADQGTPAPLAPLARDDTPSQIPPE
jgi:hypothetical protein